MPDYPARISEDHFSEARPVVFEQADRLRNSMADADANFGEKRMGLEGCALVSPSSSDSSTAVLIEEEEKCKLTALYLECDGQRSTSFDQPNQPLTSNLDDRFFFAPTIEQVSIRWEVEHPELVTASSLELFATGINEPIWIKSLDDLGGADQGTHAWMGEIDREDDHFHRCVTAAHSPYMLRLTINGPTEEGFVERYTYFDILLHKDLGLAWGTPEQIPAGRDDVHDAAWTLEKEKEVLGKLSFDENEAAVPLTADHKVLLDSNRFRHGQEGAGTHGITNHARRWGNGARIPIVAQLNIMNARRGKASVPKAIGKVQLLWDWDDPRFDAADLDPKPWQAWVDANKATHFTQKFLCKILTVSDGADTPRTYNCKTRYGGKVGDADARVLLAHEPDGAFTYKADACMGRNRDWAAFSDVSSEDGKSGAIFQPSRMGGDQYRLSVYLLQDGLNLNLSPKDLRQHIGGTNLPQATTGTFEVKRWLETTFLHLPGVALNAQAIAQIFEQQGSMNVEQNTIAVPVADYQLAMKEAIEDFKNLPPFTMGGPPPSFPFTENYAVDWTLADCAVPCKTYEDFRAEVVEALDNGLVYEVQASGLMGELETDAGAVFYAIDAELANANNGNRDRSYLFSRDGVTLKKGDTLKGPYQADGVRLNRDPKLVTLAKRRLLAENTMAWEELSNGDRYVQSWNIQTWSKQLISATLSKLNEKLLPDKEGLFCWQFGRVMAPAPIGGSSIYFMNEEGTAFVYSASPAPAATEQLFKDVNTIMAHEMAHAIFFDHASNRLHEHSMNPQSDPTPVQRDQHLEYETCLMNYDHDSTHFCGICMVHLRGWDYGEARAFADDVANDLSFEHWLAEIRRDIAQNVNSPWPRLRFATEVYIQSKLNDNRRLPDLAGDLNIGLQALKDEVHDEVLDLLKNAGAGSERISIIRSLLPIYKDWLDDCSSLAGKSFHALYADLVQAAGDNYLAGGAGDIVRSTFAASDLWDDKHAPFCTHVPAPHIVLPGPPNANPDGRTPITLRVDVNPVVPFDGQAKFTFNRNGLRFFSAQNDGNEVTEFTFDGPDLAAPGKTLYVEDSTPDAEDYAATFTLELLGGSLPRTGVAPAMAALNWTGDPQGTLRVTPSLEFVGAAVMVSKDPAHPIRKELRLRTNRTFDGTGVLGCASPCVSFYRTANGNDPIPLDNVANVFDGPALHAGASVWVQGDRASSKAKDVTITLTLSSGKTPLNSKATDITITSVDISLDICKPRSAEAVAPTRVLKSKKRNPGAFIGVNEGDDYQRREIIVNRVVPSDFDGKVVLSLPGGGRVRLFESAQPRRNDRPVGDRYTIETKKIPQGGKVLYLEGVNESAALRDVEIDLGIKDGKGRNVRTDFPGGDKVALTVVRLGQVEVAIPNTPPRTDRTANGHDNTLHPASETYNAPGREKDFEANAPLVLIEGSLPDDTETLLSVTCEPAAAAALLQWKCERAEDDDNNVKGLPDNPETPTITQDDDDPLQAVLQSNAAGSFHLMACIDPDDSKIPHLQSILNLVLVRINRLQSHTISNNPKLGAKIQGAPYNVIWNYHTNVANAGNIPGEQDLAMLSMGQGFTIDGSAVHLCDSVQVIGGGPDGLRGIDDIRGGWVNNISNHDLKATYAPQAGAPTVDMEVVFAWNRDQANTDAPYAPDEPGFTNADPNPDLVDFPILDNGRAGNPGTGGITAALGKTRQVIRHPNGQRVEGVNDIGPIRGADGINPNVGCEMLVESLDMPWTNFDLFHPADPTRFLRRFVCEYDFRAYLCFWTVGLDKLYGVRALVDWHVKGAWDVQWHAYPSAPGADDWNATFGNDQAHEFNGETGVLDAGDVGRTYSGEDANVEVRFPNTKRLNARDARV